MASDIKHGNYTLMHVSGHRPQPLRTGDMLVADRGQTVILEGGESPSERFLTGLIYCIDAGQKREYTPSRIGAEWRIA